MSNRTVQGELQEQPEMLRVEADSRVVKRGRGRPRKSERQAGQLTKQTRRALQATDPTPRKVGRPPKFSFEMVVEIINSVANGGSIINDLKRHNMSAMSFYKWLNDNPELSEQYEEAKKARIRLAVERLWRLSECVDDKGCNGRRTAAALIEKALSFQANNYRVGTRPRHKIENGPERPPVLQIVSGRPDKPPG